MNIKYIHFFNKKHYNFFFSFSRYFSSQASINSQNSFYDILELKPNCTQREIRKNYLRLAKTYHPDIYKGSDKDRFKKIKEAYEILKIPAKREEYDKKMNVKDAEPDIKAKDQEFYKDEPTKDEANSAGVNLYKDWEEIGKKINIDVEYQKFMSKETKINPEEIITSEDPLISQFNQEEKKRQEYLNYLNNIELHKLKYAHQQGYDATLNDTIKIINTDHQIKTEPEEKKKQREEINDKKKKKIWFWVQCGTAIVLIPFLINLASRKAYIKRRNLEETAKLLKLQKDYEISELHQRIVFEEK